MSEPTEKQQPDHWFKPGQSGNPKGRPKGSRNKLAESFLDAMYNDWQQHGEAVIEAVRTGKPDQYLKVVASILPKDLNVNINNLEQATDDELIQRLRSLHAVIEPFLGAQGGGGDSGGAETPSRH